MNVVIYTGPTAVAPAATHNLVTLRRLLFPHYAVTTLDTKLLLSEPWSASCALLVFPEGYESEYTEALGAHGRDKVMKYVKNGGKFLALGSGVVAACGGGGGLGFYKGSWKRDNEDGDEKYRKEAVSIEGRTVKMKKVGEFVDKEGLGGNTAEVIGRFIKDKFDKSEGGMPAVLYCKVGDGAAVLATVELVSTMSSSDGNNSIRDITKDLAAVRLGSTDSEELLRACVGRLGMNLGQLEDNVLQLSVMHISSITPLNAKKLKESWNDLIIQRVGAEYIVDANDTFCFEEVSAGKPSGINDKRKGGIPTTNRDIKKSDLCILVHIEDYPTNKQTPSFNHEEFYSNIQCLRSISSEHVDRFGSYLLYGEVITSTNTVLEKNQKLLHRLPTGFTAVATRQTAGRGRGSNVWLSPAGCLLFSVCVRHPVGLVKQAPPLFIQYIASIAVVEAVKSYGKSYDDVPVRLKWPNDIYIEDPAKLGQNNFMKIGGVLVQCSGDGKEYFLVVGIGLNVTNAAPTTSLNHVLEALNAQQNANGEESLRPFKQEKLLARILVAFEELHVQFCTSGWNKYLEDLYHKHWLHSNQIVTLDSIDGAPRARIIGITPDWAYLRAEEIDELDRGTGRMHDLQPDGNSFDFFKGLVKRKT